MHRLFQEGICRIHLRALQEWSTVSANPKDVQPLDTIADEKRCVHLVAKLMGSGSRFMLHLLIQNISDSVIESLTILLQVTDGQLVLERSSAKLSLILPSSHNWIKINVRDQTSQGGTISVIVIKEADPAGSSGFTDRGQVVCAAKISISPTI